jgi:hypothetical protein
MGFSYPTNIAGSSFAVWIYGSRNDFRLDHCKFTKGTFPMMLSGNTKGVIHNNEFLNCNGAFRVNGSSNAAWAEAIAAGTENALFVEDNLFTFDNDSDTASMNELLYHQDGARTVVRYNTIDTTAYTKGDSLWFDSHGNQNGYYDGDSDDFRGQPILEIYENVFTGHHSYRTCYLRGGSILFYNNSLNLITGTPIIVLTEQEGWHVYHFGPPNEPLGLRTEWPAQDQIINSFFWNNTINGVAMGASDLTSHFEAGSDAVFLQENRDFFMHEPAASGGKESYTGARKGGSTTAPTEDDIGNTIFDGSGENAYYPYIPYIYPHPLRNEGATPMKNLFGNPYVPMFGGR